MIGLVCAVHRDIDEVHHVGNTRAKDGSRTTTICKSVCLVQGDGMILDYLYTPAMKSAICCRGPMSEKTSKAGKL